MAKRKLIIMVEIDELYAKYSDQEYFRLIEAALGYRNKVTNITGDTDMQED